MTTYDSSDRVAPAVAPDRTSGLATSAEVIRSEERLRVGTTRYPVERVRLTRRIVTEVRQVQVEVRREELVVLREPVAEARAAAGERAGDGEVVVVLSEEVPMITMGVRPYERVRARVSLITEQQSVTEQVRHEEVVTDGGVTGRQV